MNKTTPLLLATLMSCAAISAAAEPQPSLQSLLQRAILTTNVPLTGVQAYCEARVPRMPRVKTVAEWEKVAERTRQRMFERVVFRGEAAAWRDAKTRVEWFDTIEGGPGYRIRKPRYEALPGL